MVSKLKRILLAGALGISMACGGGGGGGPTPPPTKSLSQSASLENKINIRYTATFIGVSQATRTRYHNGSPADTLIINTPNYTQTLTNNPKGTWRFDLEAPGVTTSTVSVDVPNYNPSADFTPLQNVNLDERYNRSTTTLDLTALVSNSDDNLEDRPVPVASATVLSGGVTANLNGYNLTLNAIPGQTGPYQVRVDFGNANNGQGNGTISGNIIAVPEQILFWSNRDQGTGELYIGNIINGQLTIAKRLTNNVFNDAQPAWSPNGLELVMVSNRDLGKLGIWKMSNLDGSDQATKLTPNNIDAVTPVWCIDPNNLNGPGKIYFGFKDDVGKTGIASVNPDGTGFKMLFQEDFSGNITQEPTCSSDGSKLALETSRDGDSEVYTMNIDGSNQRNITNNAAADGQPRWSSDGKIYFATDRDTPGTGELNLYGVNPDGTGLTRLTNLAGVEIDLSLSPDLTRILLTNGPVIGPYHIHLMNKDGTGLVQLTTQGQNRYPAWRPK